MWEDLMNSKMFLIMAAIVLGLLIGGLWQRITKSTKSYTVFAIPVIGILLSILMLYYVKLNVRFFDVRYTLIGMGIMAVLSIGLGLIMYQFSEKKMGISNSIFFFYAALGISIFYVFFKSELPINVTVCPDTKDVYLLLKKEDAGYFDINEDGIGYVGMENFMNGFRPKFIRSGQPSGHYQTTPRAVEIPSSKGVAHALWFGNGEVPTAINLDELMERGTIKPEELWFGSLENKNNP